MSENNMRIYSNNYLNLKLINSMTKRLKGVKAVFGNKNINNEVKINELKTKLVDTSEKEKNKELCLKQIDEAVFEIEKLIRGEIKLRHNCIYNFADDIDKFIALLRTNYESSLKIVTDDKLDLISSTYDFESKRFSINSLKKPIINQSFKDIKEIVLIISKNYSFEETPTKEFLNWLEFGIKNYKDDTCPFCGSKTINIDEIKLKYQGYIEDSKQIDFSKLCEFKSFLENQVQIVNDFVNDYDNYNKHGIECSSEYKLIVELMNKVNLFIETIKNKINKFPIGIICNDYQAVFDKLIELGFSIIKKIDIAIEQTNKEESKINVLLKGLIAKRIINNEYIKKIIESYKTITKEIKTDNLNNQLIKKEIKDLKNVSLPTEAFASFVNNIIVSLDFKFKLDINDNDYLIVPLNSTNEIQVNDISEGEKNVLSFLFFYFELFEEIDNDENIKNEISLILIDDPISSLDENNKLFLISLCKKLISLKCSTQIYILTHDWDTFCNILYGTDKTICHYEITKDNNGFSKLIKVKPTISPYEHDFIELLNAEDKTLEQIADNEVYSLPNCMRRVLENFLKFKTPKSSPTANNYDEIKKALLEENSNECDEIKLLTLLTVINVQSHKAQRNKEEVITSLKFMLNKIKTINLKHFNNMKNKKSQIDMLNNN